MQIIKILSFVRCDRLLLVNEIKYKTDFIGTVELEEVLPRLVSCKKLSSRQWQWTDQLGLVLCGSLNMDFSEIGLEDGICRKKLVTDPYHEASVVMHGTESD